MNIDGVSPSDHVAAHFVVSSAAFTLNTGPVKKMVVHISLTLKHRKIGLKNTKLLFK